MATRSKLPTPGRAAINISALAREHASRAPPFEGGSPAWRPPAVEVLPPQPSTASTRVDAPWTAAILIATATGISALALVINAQTGARLGMTPRRP